MIELAGGSYLFTNDELGTGENEMSSVNMQMEEFYSRAKDADFIIYNSTIDGAVENIGELTVKSELFRDFKAVRDGHVYCTGQNMFQQTSECADMIQELNLMFNEDTETELKFLKKLD